MGKHTSESTKSKNLSTPDHLGLRVDRFGQPNTLQSPLQSCNVVDVKIRTYGLAAATASKGKTTLLPRENQ